MAVKVAIIYYSATGTAYKMARDIEEGAKVQEQNMFAQSA